MSYEYDIIVIGGGAAGLTASGIAASLGAKILLVEAEQLGGDCTWTGCIPSKTLLNASKTAHTIREASRYGLTDQTPEINFEKLMNHVRSLREQVYEEADHPDIFREMGVEIEKGKARFVDEHRIQIEQGDEESRETTGRFIVLATGSSAFVPPIPGIEDVKHLTNESIFEINTQPDNLLIIGAGPIGIEMGQAFSRLGSRVSIVDQQNRILSKDNPELTQILRDKLSEEGIDFHLGSSVERVQQFEDGQIRLDLRNGQQTRQLSGDRLLVAAGRQPQLENLKLDRAGVSCTRNGITVDERCRTSNRHIYACGDVTGRYQFTHMSEHMAKVAVTNALLKVPKKMAEDQVPWCTYTEPEMAHVGQREQDLKAAGQSYKTYRFPFKKIDRAITEGKTEGWIRIYTRKNNGKILGADILGAHAGDLICEYALAIKEGVSLRKISDTIHPYPTYGLGNRRAADQWYVQNQPKWMIKTLQKIFGYRGEIPELNDIV